MGIFPEPPNLRRRVIEMRSAPRSVYGRKGPSDLLDPPAGTGALAAGPERGGISGAARGLCIPGGSGGPGFPASA